MPNVLPILEFTLIPVAATLLGGVWATFRVPSALTRSAFQHLAAGVVMAAVAGELLPEITAQHRPSGLILGFALGVVVMLVLRQFTERLEERAGSGNLGLIAAVGLDTFIDGLLIGVGFAAGPTVGVLLVVALTLELLFLGLSVAAELAQSGASRGRTIGTVAGLTLALLVGATLGGSLLSGVQDFTLEVVMAFGAAALLYLVTEELLVEAHEVRETALITAMFPLGFLTLLVIEQLV
ncbi:hypothetical protein Dcar01_01019 [Deinococcus carri]|uniref:Transporter n=1 Tax=Deinococcus carri TaxID=1211323 RepID=A0ABP9W684_9DEIO